MACRQPLTPGRRALSPIGAKYEVPLEENMIFSLHPQVVDQDGKVCLYTQDTFRIGTSEGENLADVPWKF